jgi:hypothetical protein
MIGKVESMDEAYRIACLAKIDKLYEPAYTVLEDGTKKYLSNSIDVTVERLSIKYFAEAVGYDREIMEIILADGNHGHRMNVVALGFPYLALKARGK